MYFYNIYTILFIFSFTPIFHLDDSVVITVHQKCEDNTLEEVLPASGGPWGEKSVDEQLLKLLSELVGEDVWEEFKTENKESYRDLIKSIEIKKRENKHSLKSKNNTYRTEIPVALEKLCTKLNRVETLKDVFEKNEAYKKNLYMGTRMLYWNKDFFEKFFQKTIGAIIKQIDDILQASKENVQTIFIVGKFSECELVIDAIKNCFRKYNISIPMQSGNAILNGAVYLGYLPFAFSRSSELYRPKIQREPGVRKMMLLLEKVTYLILFL